MSLLILSFSSQAASKCSRNGTKVIYTNGVLTKRPEAQTAMEKIEGLGLNSHIDLKTVNYRLAYNFKEDIANDFLEAAVQRFPSGFIKSLGVSTGYAAYMNFLSGGLSQALYAAAVVSITDELLRLQSEWILNYKNDSHYLQTVNEIKGHYEAAFNNGERVFAISHSQGGLFMDDAYYETSYEHKQRFFSGFQIATPISNEMHKHFGYATHDKDRLINFIRTTIGTLPANLNTPLIIDNGYESVSDYIMDFVINHGIVTTYLHDPVLRPQVIAKLIETAELLPTNCVKSIINFTKNNLHVDFDSTNPQNPDASELIYIWDFGDGSSFKTDNKKTPHNYAAPGTYTVTLKTVALWGVSAITTTIVEVTAPPPPVINPVTISYHAQNKRLNFFGISGPFGNSYRWNFGDNSTETSSEFMITHDYLENGVYTVLVEILDQFGNVIGTGTINAVALDPKIKILSSPPSNVLPGSFFSYKIQCDIGETVEMDSNFTYDYFSSDFNSFGITDFISDCTGLGKEGYGESSGSSFHDITCRIRNFTETNFYSYIVANDLNISEDPVGICNYTSNIKFYASFSCIVIDPISGEKYRSKQVTANPIEIHYSSPATCP